MEFVASESIVARENQTSGQELLVLVVSRTHSFIRCKLDQVVVEVANLLGN